MTEAGSQLPGYELVEAGVADLLAGRESKESLLVSMSSARLRGLGVDVPPAMHEQPSHRLFELLAKEGDDAHSRYNALVGRLVSFVRAADHAAAR